MSGTASWRCLNRGTWQGQTLSPFIAVLRHSFFFQAEDGIRDLTVTGVQTCALPICLQRFIAAFGRRALRRPLEADEIAAHLATARAAGTDFATQVEAVLRVMLRDPEIGRASCRERV